MRQPLLTSRCRTQYNAELLFERVQQRPTADGAAELPASISMGGVGQGSANALVTGIKDPDGVNAVPAPVLVLDRPGVSGGAHLRRRPSSSCLFTETRPTLFSVPIIAVHCENNSKTTRIHAQAFRKVGQSDAGIRPFFQTVQAQRPVRLERTSSVAIYWLI